MSQEITDTKIHHTPGTHYTIEDHLRHMYQHHRDFPTHGQNCACKDDCIRQVRNFFMNNRNLYEQFSLLGSSLLRDSAFIMTRGGAESG